MRNKIRKRNFYQNQQYEYQDIGSLIKEKRKELKLTQELISNGICSISYLSKIENNQITPNEYFVKEIMTRLDVDEELYKKTIQDREYLKKMIQSVFYKKEEEITTIYRDVVEIEHNMVINIIKLGYISYFELEDNHQYVMMLENLIQNMDDFELKCYLLFAIMIARKRHQFKRSLELIEMSQDITLGDEMIDAMICEYTYVIGQELHIQNTSFKAYNNAVKCYSKYNNYVRLSALRICYLEYLAEENLVKALKEVEILQPVLATVEEQDYVHIIKAKILLRLQRYGESTMTLNNIKDGSAVEFEKLVLLYELCVIEQDLEMKEELSFILDHYKLGKDKIKYKIYYHYLKQQEQDDLKEYLRDIAIPFSLKIHDFTSLKFYTEKLMDVCIQTSRYKEATQHYKKLQKETNRIKMIYQQ